MHSDLTVRSGDWLGPSSDSVIGFLRPYLPINYKLSLEKKLAQVRNSMISIIFKNSLIKVAWHILPLSSRI